MWHDRDEMARIGQDATRTSVRVGPQGRLVLPVELRRALDLTEGTVLAVRRDGDSLVLEPREQVLSRLRQRFASSGSLADELIRDRRAEADRELDE